jgi:hypothetical protein
MGCASLVHISWIALIFIKGIHLVLKINKNYLFITFITLISILALFIKLNSDLINFYLERELLRKDIESSYAVLTPITMTLYIVMINSNKNFISKSFLFFLNILFLVCIGSIFLGFPLIFERLAVVFLFFSAIIIPRFLAGHYLIPIIIINYLILSFRIS